MKSVTLINLATDLQKLSAARSNGTLFVGTKNNLCAKIGLLNGKAVSFHCGNQRNAQALSLLKQAGLSWYQFIPGTPQVDTEPMDHAVAVQGLLYSDSVEPLPTAQKILVVDDSSTIRKTLVKILTQNHYQSCEAENGFEALSQLNNERPDLMLLDIVMPGMDGYKVLSMTRSNSAFKTLPIIMMTGKENLLDKLKLLKSQFIHKVDCIVKPFEPPELLNKIRDCLPLSVEAANTQPNLLGYANSIP